MNEGEKLQVLIRSDKRQLVDIAKTLNVHESTIINWYKLDTLKLVNKQRLAQIGINIDTLENNSKKHDLNHIIMKNNTTIIATHKKPLYDIDAMAGNMTLFSESHTEYIIDWVDLPTLRNVTACIGVMGDSMYPTYKRGDIIAIKELQDYAEVEYGQCFVIITKESIWLKRIDKHREKNSWVLRSDNEQYGLMEVDQKKVIKLYRVRGSIRTENY